MSRRRPTLGPGASKRVSWRWEVGAPLMVLGICVAALRLSAGGLLFWGAVLVTGVGLAVFWPRR